MNNLGLPMSSVSISGRVILDMHALNNEGSEGNQLLTRMIHIADQEGNLTVVNGVSGDMLKRIQSVHIQALAEENDLPLCAGCRLLDANRINRDPEFLNELGDSNNEEILNRLLGRCTMDDTQGILITVGNRSTPRKSTVEFGWLVGVPNHNRTESYFHVKYDLAGRGAGAGGQEGANVGQNIFHRPASSGIYAVVANVELNRVGFNDISRRYVPNLEERKRRARALLASVMYTFLKTGGAHRNTQLPHMLDFSGVVAASSGTVPAPLASALSSNYDEEISRVADQLNRLGNGTVETFVFEGQGQFAEVMTNLIDRLG